MNYNTTSKKGTYINSGTKFDGSNKKQAKQTRIDLSKKNFLEILNNCMNSHKEAKKTDGAPVANQTSIDSKNIMEFQFMTSSNRNDI